VNVVVDPRVKLPRGHAYVEFEDRKEAEGKRWLRRVWAWWLSGLWYISSLQLGHRHAFQGRTPLVCEGLIGAVALAIG
jgi:hypothetical protein